MLDSDFNNKKYLKLNFQKTFPDFYAVRYRRI